MGIQNDWVAVIQFLLRRLVGLLVIVLGAVTLVFFLVQVIPSDPARAALGPEATEEMIANYRAARGLDEPVLVQYVIYMRSVMRGDLGTSIVTQRPVWEDLAAFIPATLELMLASLLITVPLGVLLGTIAAARKGRLTDHFSRIASVLGMSIPVFWLGLMLQLVFYRWLGWLPASGRLSSQLSAGEGGTGFLLLDSLAVADWAVFGSALSHLILPALALSTVNLAAISRVTRVSVLEVLRLDFIRMARSKGLSEAHVLRKHVLRNALVGITTEVGLRVGVMFGGAVLTETIFAWPGIGRYAYFAVRNVDFPVIMGFALWTTLAFATVNLVVDLLYAVIDPRISYGTSGT